jgi:putative tryptophan/tyrosine transport system substrate-binding protein
VEQGVAGIVLGGDAFFLTRRVRVLEAAARHSIPVIYPRRDFVSDGGLISYAVDFNEAYRRVGMYAARILRGANPAELPVEQVTKVELVINLKTAKALGLPIPPSILARADEVIE